MGHDEDLFVIKSSPDSSHGLINFFTLLCPIILISVFFGCLIRYILRICVHIKQQQACHQRQLQSEVIDSQMPRNTMAVMHARLPTTGSYSNYSMDLEANFGGMMDGIAAANRHHFLTMLMLRQARLSGIYDPLAAAAAVANQRPHHHHHYHHAHHAHHHQYHAQHIPHLLNVESLFLDGTLLEEPFPPKYEDALKLPTAVDSSQMHQHQAICSTSTDTTPTIPPPPFYSKNENSNYNNNNIGNTSENMVVCCEFENQSSNALIDQPPSYTSIAARMSDISIADDAVNNMQVCSHSYNCSNDSSTSLNLIITDSAFQQQAVLNNRDETLIEEASNNNINLNANNHNTWQTTIHENGHALQSQQTNCSTTCSTNVFSFINQINFSKEEKQRSSSLSSNTATIHINEPTKKELASSTECASTKALTAIVAFDSKETIETENIEILEKDKSLETSNTNYIKDLNIKLNSTFNSSNLIKRHNFEIECNEQNQKQIPDIHLRREANKRRRATTSSFTIKNENQDINNLDIRPKRLMTASLSTFVPRRNRTNNAEINHSTNTFCNELPSDSERTGTSTTDDD